MTVSIDSALGALPPSWSVRPLDRLATILSGGTPSKSRKEWWEGAIPWVSPKDMKRPRLRDTQDHITAEAAEAGSGIVPANSIFVVVRGMILAKDVPVAIAERPMAFNQDIKAIIPRDGIDPDALFYAIRARKGDLASEISSTAHGTRRIGSLAIESLRVALPQDQDEQHQIVRILAGLENALDTAGRKVRTLTGLKIAILARLFTEGLNGGLSKSTAHGAVPASWETRILDQCAVVQTGIAKGKRITGPVVERPYLRVANVQDGYLDLSEIKTIALPEDEEQRYLLRDGDVLLTEGGDFDKLGRGYVWRNQIEGCVHQNHIFAIRTNRDVLLPDFLAHQIQSPYGKAYFLNVAHKTTNLACINSAKLKEFPVLVPPIDDQSRISSAIHGIDAAINAAMTKRGRLQVLFEESLTALMSGSLRVTPLLTAEAVPSLASETATVQEPLLKYAVAVGWTRVSEQDALTLRKGASGLLFYSVLREKLIELNLGVVTPDNVESIIQRIEGARSNIEGNAEVLAWVRGQRTVFVESEKRYRNVVVVELDPDRLERNRFHVTEEWEFTNGRRTNRIDAVFLVNGIPLVVVEAKSSCKGVDEGLKQIRRYHRETPEMMTAPQVFDTTNLLDFYYGPTWSLERKSLFNWKDEEPGNFERKVKRFFARERFLRMIRDWILFFKKDDELKKAVLRQHQTRAVERVVDRMLDPEKLRGLVWHTQGSGKTFTMIKAAELILRHPSIERPTVLMLVDRNELESQLFSNLASYGLAAEVVESKRHLRELLGSDHRGLIVSMIHKFDRADADLCTRDNVIALVDEAHRSTGGDLGNYLVGALPNATIIGFTGTPIDKTAYGQGTFKVFGKDDHPKGYLDKYSIADSIADGTTLELHYTLAPNEIRVPRVVLEKEFLALQEAEGISDIEELNRILDEAVALKAFLKAGHRVEQVARFVAEHFRSNVDPLGYKAFLVGVDREACALYKKQLDRHLPAEWSQVVYTSAHNDSEQLAEFRLAPDVEKAVRRAFTKREALPKILIVTEKLLTGYDAPILYCMYLDKPMRDHALLQAIARVNRPFEDEDGVKKPCGFVVDFVGIFEKLQDALSFDSDEVSSVIKNVDVLKARFERLMSGAARPYVELSAGTIDDKTVERAIEALSSKEKREAFFSLFEEVETLYEILSPDAFLRPWIDDFGKLVALYRLIRRAFGGGGLLKDLMRKTEELVQQHAESSGLRETLPLVKIDENTLRAFQESSSGDTAKIVSLGRSLIETVRGEGEEQPFLIPIGERADAVLERFGDRQESTEQALRAIQQLAEEYLEARAEAEGSGLDANTFGILWLLKKDGVPSAAELAPLLNDAIARRPAFRDNPAELRLLKTEIYKLLLARVGKDRMVDLAESLLRLPRK